MKRKVQYQVWIPAKKVDPNKPIVTAISQQYSDGTIKEIRASSNIHPATNCFSEPSTGYFHSWGIETIELAEDTVSNTIAIVEDCITGYVHKVDPTKMRFILPPDQTVQSLVYNKLTASQNLSQGFDLLELGAALLDQIQIISNKLNNL